MKHELLAPAGSLDALKAAIAAGADAIYLGAASHGARASVGFDDETLQAAIKLAHLYGRRVYVTVNTLVKPNEMEGVRNLLARLVLLRADAVIVQDLGLVRLIKREFPGLCVHASTQMSIHNAAGARFLKKLGVSRVVLARECGLEDIQLTAGTGIETEVFVHGAMCVSVSGQCQFSSQIGGRSGDRGECAPPCRLQYTYKDKSGALLSMHDMNTLAHLPDLIQAGVGSFKIEGRLKRPEYVFIVTAIYRKALDRAIKGLPLGDLAEEEKALAQIFSRGFTAGHIASEQDSSLIGHERVSHLGIPHGQILSFQQRDGFVLAQARMNLPLNNGDGLQIRGREDIDLIYSGPPIPMCQVATLRLRQAPVIGERVYRLQDEDQLEAARRQAQIMPALPIQAELTLNVGAPARLCVDAGKTSVTVEGADVQPAMKQPLDRESARKQIQKTGDTPFVLNGFSYINDQPAFLPNAALNALRREALEQLEQAVVAAHALQETAPAAMNLEDVERTAGQVQKLYGIINIGDDEKAYRNAGLEQVIYYSENYRQGQLEGILGQIAPGSVLLLPRQIRDLDLQRVVQLANDRNIYLMADNISQLGLENSGITLCGEGIPVWNEGTLQMLARKGIKTAVLSRELSANEIEQLPKDIIELVLPVYGRNQLMQLNHCPERTRLGLSKSKTGCTLCQRGQGLKGQAMVDRYNCAYPLSPTRFDHSCLIDLHHNKAQHLSTLAPAMSWLMDLRLTEKEEALDIIRHYDALRQGRPIEPNIQAEPGRFLVGVE